MAIPSFVDQVTLHVYGGNGGNGCASVHREKFKPLGGPDGGNGGGGGSVILRVEGGVTTLVDYHRQSHRRAGNGVPGKGDHSNGANGEDVVLAVPDGTVVTDAETGQRLADLTGVGAEVVASAAGVTLTTRRPRLVPNSTCPWTRANRVSSPPRPTPSPGWKCVPRCRTMISPAFTT